MLSYVGTYNILKKAPLNAHANTCMLMLARAIVAQINN